MLVVLTTVIAGYALLQRNPKHHAKTAFVPTSASPAASRPISTSTSAASSSSHASAVNTAAVEAQQLDELLQGSTAARQGVQPALDDISNCRTTASDLDALRRAASIREGLIRRLSESPISAIPNAAELATKLRSLWQRSIFADNSYLAWANAQSGCTGVAPEDANKAAADAYSVQAAAAKVSFLQQWNSIAVQYGLQPRDQGQI